MIRLYDYVDITPEMRDRALSGAANILRRAGIDVQFLNCHATTTHPVVKDASNTRLKPWELVAGIVPRGMYPKLSRPSETYGVALARGKNPVFCGCSIATTSISPSSGTLNQVTAWSTERYLMRATLASCWPTRLPIMSATCCSLRSGAIFTASGT